MIEWIQTAASATIVMAFIAGVLSKIAIAPLTSAIQSLQASFEALGKELKEERERRQAVELRLIALEQRSKSNTHRIDKLEEIKEVVLHV